MTDEHDGTEAGPVAVGGCGAQSLGAPASAVGNFSLDARGRLLKDGQPFDESQLSSFGMDLPTKKGRVSSGQVWLTVFTSLTVGWALLYLLSELRQRNGARSATTLLEAALFLVVGVFALTNAYGALPRLLLGRFYVALVSFVSLFGLMKRFERYELLGDIALLVPTMLWVPLCAKTWLAVSAAHREAVVVVENERRRRIDVTAASS